MASCFQCVRMCAWMCAVGKPGPGQVTKTRASRCVTLMVMVVATVAVIVLLTVVLMVAAMVRC